MQSNSGFKNQAPIDTKYLIQRRQARIDFFKKNIGVTTTPVVKTATNAVYGRSIVRDKSFMDRTYAYGD